jgi:hypothetical protein
MGGVQKCQFCGADVSKIVVPKVVGPTRPKSTAFETPKWVWWAYYGLAAWWILSALVSIGFTLSQGAGKTSGANILYSMVPDLLGLIMGIGLALKIRLIRRLANWGAGLKILFGLFGMLGGFIVTGISPLLGLIVTFLNIFNIVFGALTIYLLAETADNLFDD